MDTYELTTDVPENSTSHEINADGCHWEQPPVKRGNETVVAQEHKVLVFTQGEKTVAQFRAEHVVGWNIKHGAVAESRSYA